MRHRVYRALALALVCAVALGMIGQAAGSAKTVRAAASASAVQPITGAFSGYDNENGIVTSWSGSARFATKIDEATCCGLTSGVVRWSVTGTERGTGCSEVGSGQFSIDNGKMAGIEVGARATISPPYYSIDFQTTATDTIPGFNEFGPVTETCPGHPPSTTTTTTSITAFIFDSGGGPYKIGRGGQMKGRNTLTFGDGSREKSWSWNFQGPAGCPHPNVRTGKGYKGLSQTMKSRLSALYSALEGESACYQFVIGFRNETTQKDLYDRWHHIADGHKGEKGLCASLKAAGFAQCPTGWRSDGTAKGGPAKPGSSRHEHAEAADINVTFPPSYAADTNKFRAAAHRVGLCGPPATDPVHVELPYKTKGQKKASCHFD